MPGGVTPARLRGCPSRRARVRAARSRSGLAKPPSRPCRQADGRSARTRPVSWWLPRHIKHLSYVTESEPGKAGIFRLTFLFLSVLRSDGCLRLASLCPHTVLLAQTFRPYLINLTRLLKACLPPPTDGVVVCVGCIGGPMSLHVPSVVRSRALLPLIAARPRAKM